MSGYGALVSSGLHFAGPDQGIDFTGKGTIFAPGTLKITRVDSHSGWPGGHLIVGQLLDGAHKGRYVYFAEALTPVSGLKSGDVISKGVPIATLNSRYPGTEIGWAQDASGAAYGTTSDGKPGGPSPTFGKDFESFITGTPSGVNLNDVYIDPKVAAGSPDVAIGGVGAIKGQANAELSLAQKAVNVLMSAFAGVFGKAFLYFVLVAGGGALVVIGVARTAGVKPSSVALKAAVLA